MVLFDVSDLEVVRLWISNEKKVAKLTCKESPKSPYERPNYFNFVTFDENLISNLEKDCSSIVDNKLQIDISFYIIPVKFDKVNNKEYPMRLDIHSYRIFTFTNVADL